MNKYTEKINQIMIQLAEEDKRKEEKEKEKEVKEKEKEKDDEVRMKEKKEKKEKKFSERFSHHFAESSKDMHDRMCALEESVKKVVEMSEKHFNIKNKE